MRRFFPQEFFDEKYTLCRLGDAGSCMGRKFMTKNIFQQVSRWFQTNFVVSFTTKIGEKGSKKIQILYRIIYIKENELGLRVVIAAYPWNLGIHSIVACTKTQPLGGEGEADSNAPHGVAWHGLLGFTLWGLTSKGDSMD